MSSADGTCSCSRPRCNEFGLAGVPPTVFVKTQCPMHYSVYLVYRLLVTSYLFGYFLYDLIVSVRPGGTYTDGYYLIYLTNWGYILMLVYMFCALWNLIVYAACMRRSGWTADDGVPWYYFHRCQWLLFNIYAAVAILIVIMYWSLSYTPGTYDLYYDINFHLLNGVFALVEVLLTATVVRILYFIYPFAFVSVYNVFSVIYWAAGGTDEEGNPYIYPILDYGADPGAAAGLAVGMCGAVAVGHIVLVWGVHKLKLWMFGRLCPSCMPEEYDLESHGYEGL